MFPDIEKLERRSRRAVDAIILLVLCLLVLVDARWSSLGVSGVGYSFAGFSGWEPVSKRRKWLLPAMLCAIAVGGLAQWSDDRWAVLRLTLAAALVGALFAEIRRPVTKESEPDFEFDTEQQVMTRQLVGDELELAGIAEALAEQPRESSNGMGPLRGQGFEEPDSEEQTASYAVDPNAGLDDEWEEPSSSDLIDGQTDPTSSEVCKRLEESGAFDTATVKRMLELASEESDSDMYLAACGREKLLSKFQIQCVREGQERSLRVENYTVQSVIGRGAMGVVYKALDRSRGHQVALKLFNNQTDQIARIRREMAVLRELAHPNIIIALEAGESNGREFIAMEYIEGETLRQIVKRTGALELSPALHVILQVCSALEQAHSRGVLHRDIKPGNIMVTPSGDAKLLDLGISLPPKDLRGFDTFVHQGQMIVGTAGFMSPEQSIGERELTVTSDLFSIGATLFNILTGETIVEGATWQDRLLNTRDSEKWKTLDEDRFPAEIRALVGKLTAYESEDRYQTVTELLDDLRPIMRAFGVIPHDGLVHVLIVEDAPTDAMLAQRLLERSNQSLEVSVVVDFAAAHDAVWVHTESSTLPLIVLFDLNLPDSEPHESVRRIADLRSAQVHVIAMTGADDRKLRKACRKAGAVEFLVKGEVTSQQLERAIFSTYGRLPPSHRLVRE